MMLMIPAVKFLQSSEKELFSTSLTDLLANLMLRSKNRRRTPGA